MPREFVLLSLEPVSMQAIGTALLATEPDLSLTMSDHRLLGVIHDHAGMTLLTLVHSRALRVPSEVARLLPPIPEPGVRASWWTDVLVPWGDAEERGTRIVQELAAAMEAALYDPLGGAAVGSGIHPSQP